MEKDLAQFLKQMGLHDGPVYIPPTREQALQKDWFNRDLIDNKGSPQW